MYRFTICTILASIIAIATAWTQVRQGNNAISGVIVDSFSGLPIPMVDVFLRGTTKGAVTGNDGTYDLTGLPDGEYELIISILGYERSATPVKLTGSTHVQVRAKLKPRAISVPQVEVTGSAELWKQLLPVFKNVFLGTTENAAQSVILNPEVISLSIGSTGDSLQARTDSTLIVDNFALGYRIYVEIDSCIVISLGARYAIRWFPRFKELVPRDKDQEEMWNKRREECYRYSFTHFLRSAMNGRLRKDDFLVRGGDARELLHAKGEEVLQEELRTIAFNDSTVIGIDFGVSQLRVDRLDDFGSWKASMDFLAHPENPLVTITAPVIRPGSDFKARGARVSTPGNNEAMIDRQSTQDKMVEKYSSIVRMKEKLLLVDRNGNLVKPFSVVLNGYWGTLRLADTLPFDYAPE